MYCKSSRNTANNELVKQALINIREEGRPDGEGGPYALSSRVSLLVAAQEEARFSA